jgi:hypothetical protein
VGKVFSLDRGPVAVILVPVADLLLPLSLGSIGFLPSGALHFVDSLDCTGTPYMPVCASCDIGLVTSVNVAAVAPPGRSVYVPDLSQATLVLPDGYEGSYLLRADDITTSQCRRVGHVGRAELRPARRLLDLDTLPFQPPFSLRRGTQPKEARQRRRRSILVDAPV